MKLCCFAFSVGLYVSQFVCLTIRHVLCFCFGNCFVLKNGCQFYLLMKFWNSNFKKLIITRQVKHSKHANKNKLIVDNSTEKNLFYIYSSELQWSTFHYYRYFIWLNMACGRWSTLYIFDNYFPYGWMNI